METYEQKVMRVATALWGGFGGQLDYFRRSPAPIYLTGARYVIAEADRDDVPIGESYEDKIARGAAALSIAWGDNHPNPASDSLYLKGVKAALEEEARDIEEEEL